MQAGTKPKRRVRLRLPRGCGPRYQRSLGNDDRTRVRSAAGRTALWILAPLRLGLALGGQGDPFVSDTQGGQPVARLDVLEPDLFDDFESTIGNQAREPAGSEQ